MKSYSELTNWLRLQYWTMRSWISEARVFVELKLYGY